VTKLFYGRGWHGINIEPVSYWYKRICIDRPRDINLQVAASSTSGVVRLYEVADTGLSTAIREFALQACSERGLPLREYDVPTQTLDAICAEHNVTEVHFLKIDAEGYEPEILRGFGFSKVRPWVVVVESVNPNSRIPSYKTWEPGLIERGYECVHWDGLNRFYLAKEHAELKAALDPPPNPAVMGVVRAAEARLLRLANARQFELGGVEVSTSGKFVSLFIKAMRVAHREGLSQMIRKTMRYLARRILSS
jgi:FkbM family methyltransferase